MEAWWKRPGSRGFAGPVALLLCVLICMAAPGLAASHSVSDFQRRGLQPVSGPALSRMIVGHALLWEELTSRQRFEAIFLPSGMRLLRPRGEVAAGVATLRAQHLSTVSRYTVSDDRVSTTFEGEETEFQIYQVGDATYAHRLRDGDEVRWRLIPRGRAGDVILVADLMARGYQPVPGRRLRDLVAGRTLTLLQRSSGTLTVVTFRIDGTSSVRGADGTLEDDVRYSIFQNQLVTTIDERPVYITVYDTPRGFLGALNTDSGVVDWEIVYRE